VVVVVKFFELLYVFTLFMVATFKFFGVAVFVSYSRNI